MSASSRFLLNREFRNLSAITWAHAVNSQLELTNVLSSKYYFCQLDNLIILSVELYIILGIYDLSTCSILYKFPLRISTMLFVGLNENLLFALCHQAT